MHCQSGGQWSSVTPRRVQLKQCRIKLVFVEQLEKIAPDGAK
jgi:hypothetical protein